MERAESAPVILGRPSGQQLAETCHWDEVASRRNTPLLHCSYCTTKMNTRKQEDGIAQSHARLHRPMKLVVISLRTHKTTTTEKAEKRAIVIDVKINLSRRPRSTTTAHSIFNDLRPHYTTARTGVNSDGDDGDGDVTNASDERQLTLTAPKFSDEDIRRGEVEAATTIRAFLVTSAILYLSPFAVETLWKVL
ncbi:hypothetical protein F503_01210 [Ophiostoma piceae UAMH 11346]|uniref:Uncharacterized protein n=1 Tax=Ophiostoma piceae (strain UAMH 11346) TaxID=1262450 RepID=S3C6J7_OPHP1|nr:hypothetical protein F503_01210 [Ophiostoma piceae UAMH 11346]